MEKFLKATIQDVCRLCESGFYDFIIVGTGMGGGVLAQSLLENGSSARVLLIERGGLLFSTHCLNTSRPHWSHNIPAGPSQDNDIVYQSLKEPVNTVTQGSYPYVGGEIYCLGGRGNVWGLYTPKVHPDDLESYFPESVCSYLEKGGYERAYQFLSNDPEASLEKAYPSNGAASTQTVDKVSAVIDDLNRDTKELGCSFTSCPLAAEFVPRRPERAIYQFPMGAFSPVSWILDRVYNRDERLTVLANTRVVAVNRKSDDQPAVVSLVAIDSSGEERNIPVGNATVILSAGTLGTASIALRSGLGEGRRNDPGKPTNLVGRGLMDHDIWGTRFEVLQSPNLAVLNKQPLKLNSWVKFADEPVLVNVAVNADTFLGRTQVVKMPTVYLDQSLDEVPEAKFNEALEQESTSKSVVQVAFCLTAPLDNRNRVLNRPEPTTTIKIEHIKDNSCHIPTMQRIAQAIGASLGRKVAGTGTDQLPPLPKLGKTGFGMVAHEVGTMRMGEKEGEGVVDENLKMTGLSNLYVCDLSVLPVSPAANPSLTLVALAQRLADHLLKVGRHS